MNTIIKILEDGTKVLKEEYFSKVKEWAKKNYKNAHAIRNYTAEQWCNKLGIAPEIRNGCKVFPKGFYNTSASKQHFRILTEANKLAKMKEVDYINKLISQAEITYQSSLLKLAKKIENLEMDYNNLHVVTGKVNININTVITDGIKKIEAYTIIASGPIQRPHYRYLIKKQKI